MNKLDILKELERVKKLMQRYNFIKAYKVLQSLMDNVEGECGVGSYRAALIREKELVKEWQSMNDDMRAGQ